MIHKQMRSSVGRKKTLKKNVQILRQKNTMDEIKNAIDNINSRMGQGEESVK